MFRSVLAPLDGSRLAESALPVAARLARDARATLHLVRVTDRVAALLPMGEPMLLADKSDALLVPPTDYLAQTVIGLMKQGFAQAEYTELEGLPGPSLCEEATRVAADFVVLTKGNRSGARRHWLGSVADYAIRHLTVPILLVHPDGLAWSSPSLRKILVALDLSKAAEAVLEPVTTLARLTQGHVTLLHILPAFQDSNSPSAPYQVLLDPASLERRHTHAQQALDALADRLRDRGVSVSTRVKMGISPEGALLEALESDRFDLVALTASGAGGMRRLLLGSVADSVLRGALKPVLVLRPPPVL